MYNLMLCTEARIKQILFHQVGLMEELDEISPAYAMPSYLAKIGFHGRPGYKNLGRASHTNVPWSDTVSDVRAAVVLLLLHRYAKYRDQ